VGRAEADARAGFIAVFAEDHLPMFYGSAEQSVIFFNAER